MYAGLTSLDAETRKWNMEWGIMERIEKCGADKNSQFDTYLHWGCFWVLPLRRFAWVQLPFLFSGGWAPSMLLHVRVSLRFLNPAFGGLPCNLRKLRLRGPICKINNKGILLVLFEMLLRLFLRRHFLQKAAQRATKNVFFLLCTATIITPNRVRKRSLKKNRLTNWVFLLF